MISTPKMSAKLKFLSKRNSQSEQDLLRVVEIPNNVEHSIVSEIKSEIPQFFRNALVRFSTGNAINS